MLINTVTPKDFPRKPWANTIAYYQLTTSTTISDMSGNNRNLTQVDNSTFWTYNWVNCVYVSWSNASWFHCLYTRDITSNVLGTQFTVQFWGNRDNSKNIRCGWGWANGSWNGYNLFIDENWKAVCEALNNWSINSISYSWGYSAWTWYLITWTYDNWSCKLYINWTQVASWTYTAWAINVFWVGTTFGTEATWYTYQWNGYVSKVILENKVRTAQEINDYYNWTKADYWL